MTLPTQLVLGKLMADPGGGFMGRSCEGLERYRLITRPGRKAPHPHVT